MKKVNRIILALVVILLLVVLGAGEKSCWPRDGFRVAARALGMPEVSHGEKEVRLGGYCGGIWKRPAPGVQMLEIEIQAFRWIDEAEAEAAGFSDPMSRRFPTRTLPGAHAPVVATISQLSPCDVSTIEAFERSRFFYWNDKLMQFRHRNLVIRVRMLSDPAQPALAEQYLEDLARDLDHFLAHDGFESRWGFWVAKIAQRNRRLPADAWDYAIHGRPPKGGTLRVQLKPHAVRYQF